MVSTRSMVLQYCRDRLAARCYRRIFNPGFSFRPGPSPRPRYIQLEVHNVEIAETQFVHFDRCYPIPRYIDLSED